MNAHNFDLIFHYEGDHRIHFYLDSEVVFVDLTLESPHQECTGNLIPSACITEEGDWDESICESMADMLITLITNRAVLQQFMDEVAS